MDADKRYAVARELGQEVTSTKEASAEGQGGAGNNCPAGDDVGERCAERPYRRRTPARGVGPQHLKYAPIWGSTRLTGEREIAAAGPLLVPAI